MVYSLFEKCQDKHFGRRKDIFNKVKLLRAGKIFHSRDGLSWLETPHIGRVGGCVVCVLPTGRSVLPYSSRSKARASCHRYVRAAILHSIQHSRSRSSSCLFPIFVPSITNGTRSTCRRGMTKPHSLSSFENRYDGPLLTDTPQYFFITDLVRSTNV